MSSDESKGGDESSAPRAAHPGGSRLLRVLAAIITGWALIGGIIILALVLITAASAISNVFFNRPLTGEYELAKHFVAIAIFCFLPYCQLVGANVRVDIFTEGMSMRGKAATALLSAILAVAFSLLLLKQMSAGFVSYLEYVEITPMLGLPLWTAFPPILVSLALLLVAGLMTTLKAWQILRGGADPAAQA